jgi:hypothetical protein
MKTMTEQEKMVAMYQWTRLMHGAWTDGYGTIDKALGWEPSNMDPLQVEDKDEFIRIIMDFYEGQVGLDEEGLWIRE